MADAELQYVIRAAVRNAVAKARAPMDDAQLERIVDSIMADAEWQRHATEVWGPMSLQPAI